MHQMFIGITPTIILIRVSLGFSFHDEKSMSEIIGTLRFNSDENMGLDRSIQQGGDIEVVETDDITLEEMYNITHEYENGE